MKTMNNPTLDRLVEEMDRKFEWLRDFDKSEREIATLVSVAYSLVQKLAERDKIIEELKLRIKYLEYDGVSA
jgi:predicted RNase H-like nuclease (RuvC/YqgF family)